MFRTAEDEEREDRLKKEHLGGGIPRVLLLRESPHYQDEPLPAWGDDPDSPDLDLVHKAKRHATKYMAHSPQQAVTDNLQASFRELADDNTGGCSIVRHGFTRTLGRGESFRPIAVYAGQTAGMSASDCTISSIYKQGQHNLPSDNNDDILCLHVQHQEVCDDDALTSPQPTVSVTSTMGSLEDCINAGTTCSGRNMYQM